MTIPQKIKDIFQQAYTIAWYVSPQKMKEYVQAHEAFKKFEPSNKIKLISENILSFLNSPHFHSQLSSYFTNRHEEGVPFTDFDLEPDNVSQIKKLLNALYHAYHGLVYLEKINLRELRNLRQVQELLLSKELHEAAEHIYTAGYLLTHVDMDIPEIFKEEFSLLLSLINQVKDSLEARSKSPQAQELIATLNAYRSGRKIGQVTGIAIEQLQPVSGEMDYDFLTQFSALLPGYIKRFTDYIKQFSHSAIENQSSTPLNQAKIEELRKTALELLNDLDNLRGGSIFVSFKFLKYIHVIRNIFTLTKSSLDQVGYLNESSQEVLRDNLRQLKYHLFPTLFALVDKIEVNSLLQPGTLSIPLMEQMKKLYEGDGDEWKGLIYYVGKPVDFSIRGEELRKIEDSRFVNLRLEEAYQRINAAKNELYRLNKVINAFNNFYTILEEPQHVNMHLRKLPIEVKKRLIEHYKLIRPYVNALNMDLDILITENLLLPQNSLSRLDSYLEDDDDEEYIQSALSGYIKFITNKKASLHNLLTKKKVTQEFLIQVNNDLISSVQKNTSVSIFPYSDTKNIFAVDESAILATINDDLILKNKQEQEALKQFFALLEDSQYKNLFLHELPQEIKKQLLVHYQSIKSYTADLPINFEAWLIHPQTQNGFASFSQLYHWIIGNELQGNCSQEYISSLLSQKSTLEEFINKKKEKEQQSCEQFFALLEKPEYKNLPLYELPETVRKQLIEHYQLLKPFFAMSNIDFEEMLIKPSTHTPSRLASMANRAINFGRKVLRRFQPPIANNVITLLAQHQDIKQLIDQKKLRENTAFTQFFTLLEDQNQPFTQLPETTKKQLEIQYKVISPYMGTASVLAQKITLTNRIHNKYPALVYAENAKQNLITNTEHLTSNQALCLAQWYQNKLQQLKSVQKTYEELFQLSSTATISTTALEPEIKKQYRVLYSQVQPYLINGLPEGLRKNAIEFDKLFVRYLSDTQAPRLSRDGFPQFRTYIQRYFDSHIQQSFTDMTNQWTNRSQFYLTLSDQQFLAEQTATSLKGDPINPRAHHVLTHTKYSTATKEFRTELLQLTSFLNAPMKAELRLKSTQVGGIERMELAREGLPYPELMDEYQKYAQSRQVEAIKEIFNTLYYAEEIMHELERLKHSDNNTNKLLDQGKYCVHLIQAGLHLHKIWKLSNNLAQDPHFSLIGRELLQKAQLMLAKIQEHSDGYQTSSDMVTEVPGTVRYNGIWYNLNAFYVIPKHIRSAMHLNDLTVEELDELHQRAKNASLTIEALMKNSNSYFKLFLQSPAMISLYKELKNKLNEFMSTVHDGMIDNVSQFRSKIFTPMLLEADQWEDRLGLAPGTLSEPLKNITDEYYKGLLHPLNLPSKTHIELACDLTPLKKRDTTQDQELPTASQAPEMWKANYYESIETRIKTTKKMEALALQNLDKLKKNYESIENLFILMQAYKRLGNNFITNQLVLNEERKKLIAAYKLALPKLIILQTRVPIDPDPDQEKESIAFDKMLNDTLKEYEPKLTQLSKVITASYHYYQGRKASYKMTENSAKEKLIYLDRVKKEQGQANIAFIKTYTSESFNKTVTALSNRHIGLQWTDKEYNNKLKAYLFTFKEEIVEQAHTAEDINAAIRKLLKKKTKLFEEEHFAAFYHLDTIRTALSRFKNYFRLATDALREGHLFENEHTLDKKTGRINTIIELCDNANIPLNKRFTDIQAHVLDDATFKGVMLAHKEVNHFSFTYLKILFLSLCEAIGLYSPERQIYYTELDEAVKNKPQISELATRFGLFAEAAAPANRANEVEPINAPAA